MNQAVEHRGRQWHLEKSVSIGHIISTFAIAGSMMLYITNVDKRVDLIKASVKHVDDKLIAHEIREDKKYIELKSESREDFKQVNHKLDRFDQKLDRLLERNK